MVVGRVLVDGRDGGSGFALTPRLAVTANHVVGGYKAESLQFTTADERPVQVSRVESDEQLDVAVLRLAKPVPGDLAVGQVVSGAGWEVEARPRGNDPLLTGIVDSTRRRLV